MNLSDDVHLRLALHSEQFEVREAARYYLSSRRKMLDALRHAGLDPSDRFSVEQELQAVAELQIAAMEKGGV